MVMPAAAGVSTMVALQRNRRSADRRVAPLRAADLEIDALRRRIRQGTREVGLSPVEHILLYTLAARAGAVVSYRELADALGSTDGEVRNNTLARHISSLRRKLRDEAERPRYVETVPNLGYRFVTPSKT
jgi:DNA-binding response OmpR family regulator